MLPKEILRGGQPVVMTADPTDASLVPLGGNGSHSGAASQKLDVVFPVMHGTYGEDGTIQGLLDLAGLPFVGAGVLGSAVGMDKDVAKKLLQVAKIPVVPWVTVHRYEWEKNPKQVQKTIESKFKYPVFVKPAALGSSVGMTKVHSRAELAPALNLASEFAMKILVEKSVVGARDRSFRARQQRSESIDSRRNRSASRILRLHGEISGRRNAAFDSGEAQDRADQDDSEAGGSGVSRAGTERHGARRFLSRETRRRKIIPQRSEYDSGFHFDQHVSRSFGKRAVFRFANCSTN